MVISGQIGFLWQKRFRISALHSVNKVNLTVKSYEYLIFNDFF